MSSKLFSGVVAAALLAAAGQVLADDSKAKTDQGAGVDVNATVQTGETLKATGLTTEATNKANEKAAGGMQKAQEETTKTTDATQHTAAGATHKTQTTASKTKSSAKNRKGNAHVNANAKANGGEGNETKKPEQPQDQE